MHSERQGLGRWDLAALAAGSLLLLRLLPVLKLGWAWDDLEDLLVVLDRSPFDYLFNPAANPGGRLLFTPIHSIANEINLFLFGVNPFGFYLNQLIAAWVLFVVTYGFLRLWCRVLPSFLGAVLATSSGPVLITVIQLMDVHYLVGLSIMVVAFGFFVLSLRMNRPGLVWLGALAYLLAMLSKEVYVPLIVVLPLIPEGSFRERLHRSAPFVGALVIYLVWRTAMLGALVTPFGVDSPVSKFLQLPFRIPVFLLGDDVFGWLAIIVFFVVLCGALMTSPRLIPLAAAVAAGVLLPLAPIAFRIDSQERALLLPAWAGCVAFALGLERLLQSQTWAQGGRRSAQIRAVVMLLFFVAIYRQSDLAMNEYMTESRRFSAVAEFMLHGSEDAVLFAPDGNQSEDRGRRLRERLGMGTAPRVAYDPRQLTRDPSAADASGPAPRVFQYQRGVEQLVDITDGVQALQADWNARTEQRPLFVEFTREGRGTRWEFGPYQGNRYSVINLSAPFSFRSIDATGIYYGRLPPMTFLVRYQSPEGWLTYSDQLQWGDEEPPLHWERTAAP